MCGEAEGLKKEKKEGNESGHKVCVSGIVRSVACKHGEEECGKANQRESECVYGGDT